MELDALVMSRLRRIVEAKAPERAALDNALRLAAKMAQMGIGEVCVFERHARQVVAL